MARGIKRKVKASLDAVNAEISSERNPKDLFSRGLSQEGFAGGYATALRDVLAALDGHDERSRYWRP